MKVNFIVDGGNSLQGSGIYSSASRLARYLKTYDIEVDINGKRRSYDIYHFHTALPTSFIKSRLLQSYVKRIPNKFRPKIIMHGHTTVEDYHNSFILSNHLDFLLYPYLRNFYLSADHVIAVSQHNKNVLMSYGIPPEKITVISNGVHLSNHVHHGSEISQKKELNRKRKKILKKLGLPEDGLIIFSIGIGIYRKGVDIFAQLAERMPNHLFIWIGRQLPLWMLTKRREIKNARQTAKKLKNLYFTGFLNEHAFLSVLDYGQIFLYPTREENQGIALLEAMLLGKTPIVSQIPVFNWLTHEYNCLKADNIDSFAKQIEFLEAHPEKIRQIGKNAQISVKEHTLNKTAQKILQLYTDVLAN